MASRALLCRHAASVSREFVKPVHYFHKPVRSRCSGCRWSASVAAAVTVSDARVCSAARRYNSPIQVTDRLPQRSKRHAVGAEEHKIWSCIQHGSIYNAVALSHKALEKSDSRSDIVALSPLTHFVLSKRRFQVDSLLVGVCVALCHIHPDLDLSSKELVMVLAAFLSETSPDILDKYCDLSDKQLEVTDTIFLASTAFHYLQAKHYRRAHALSRHLAQNSWSLVKDFWANPLHWRSQIPKSIEQTIRAAWMLRHPDSGSVDVTVASALVTKLIRMDIIPDPPVLEKLLSFSISQKKPREAISIYASKRAPVAFSKAAIIRLASSRTILAQYNPRIHHDLLGSFVREDDLKGALALATAMGCRAMFHLLLSLWSSHHPCDWKGIVCIVQTMLGNLDCKFLHSTQSLATKTMLDASKQRENDRNVAEILNSLLRMHWQLLPRLESISVAALHRIVHALVRNRKLRDAFRIYRHAERHIESAQLRELFETDSIFVLLARGLAQRGDIRSITHLADAVTQRGIQMSVHFYTSLICGLLSDIKLRRVTHRHGRNHYAVFVLERVQMAESLLNIVRRNKIPCPPKVYYTIMYGWAILGCPKMAQKYFDRISLLKLPDSHAAGSRSGVNQTTWGILMYAYVCARDARGAMHVLERAKEWMKDTAVSGVIRTDIDNTDPDGHKTNHLINMAMTVLIRRKDATGALALLDSFLEKHSESQSTSDTALELPATSADPVTLNLILRALLLNDQLHNAVRVYDMTHSDFKLLETPDALRPLLRYYTQKNDLNGVFLLTKRIFRLGGIPTLKELFYMVRLSIYKRDSALILYLFDRLNTTTASNRESKFMYFIKRNPAMVPLVYWALVDGGREDDAQNIESMYGDMMSRAPDRSQLLQPPTLAQRKAVAATKAHARCISLYRDLLREIDDFPLVEMRKKLRYNARFVFELYRDLKPQDPLIGQLLEDGEQQKQWLRKWHNDQDGWQFVTHSSPTPAMGLAGSQ